MRGFTVNPQHRSMALHCTSVGPDLAVRGAIVWDAGPAGVMLIAVLLHYQVSLQHPLLILRSRCSINCRLQAGRVSSLAAASTAASSQHSATALPPLQIGAQSAVHSCLATAARRRDCGGFLASRLFMWASSSRHLLSFRTRLCPGAYSLT